MVSWYRVAMWTVLLAVVAVYVPAPTLAGLPTGTTDLGTRSATITLGRSPEPPDCSQPESDVSIWWNITYSTNPQKVIYTLRDPNGATIDSVYYAGATGVVVNTSWHVPFAAVVGKYWVRVEYWSYQAGHEATAEVSFYVCSGIGSICAQKWVDADCNGQGTAGDHVLSGWWICIETPWGDTFCDTTGVDGRVCWDHLPVGTYTVSEIVSPPWTPIFAPVREAVLTETNPNWGGAFFNQNYDECFGACCKCNGDCVEVTRAMCDEVGYMFMGLGTHCEGTHCGAPSATEKTTWGAIKDNYR
jgi:hypothetical protein